MEKLVVNNITENVDINETETVKSEAWSIEKINKIRRFDYRKLKTKE